MDGGLSASESTTPFPAFADDNPSSPELSRPSSSSSSRSRNDSVASGHKRSFSGNILSKLPFLRTSSDTAEKLSLSNGSADGAVGDEQRPAVAAIVQQKKARRRKGSLRKTALLLSGRPSNTRSAKSPLGSPQSPESVDLHQFPSLIPPDSDATPRPSRDLHKPTSPVSPPNWTSLATNRSLLSINSSIPSVEPASSNASVTSPTLPTDASTTDDDDAFPRISLKNGAPKPPSSSGDSYFPPVPVKRRMPRTKSPLATQPHSVASTPITDPDEWDYTETAYWGYVILITTWLVCVVGIGSCLGVWSWAWDVGETPYAPPELEDDPTLPIVGYYPALMVLTCVMACVWVVVAWIGMKYFRHADFHGDD